MIVITIKIDLRGMIKMWYHDKEVLHLEEATIGQMLEEIQAYAADLQDWHIKVMKELVEEYEK